MTDILRSLAGNLLGLDKDDNLLIKGKKVITDYLGTPIESSGSLGEVSIPPQNNAQVAIQAAYDLLSTTGGGVIKLGAGTFTFTGNVHVKDFVTVKGAGMGVTNIQQATTGFECFSRSGTFTGMINYAAFEDFTVIGTWLTNQSQANTDRHFNVNGVHRVRCVNVECLYSRTMSITFSYCDEVLVTGCRVRYSARDAINITGCRRPIVTFNHIIGVYDDAIAWHQTSGAGNPPNEGGVIEGNTIEDSFGIKCLGITKASISNNSLRRVKGHGIYTLVGGIEGYSDELAVTITGNTITDIINANKFGSGALCAGIYFGAASRSWAELVAPGTPPTINYPESLYYLSNNSGNANAGAQNILISGNTIMGWTLPAGSYSAWGFGLPFLDTGFADVDLSSGFKFSQNGIQIDGPILSMSISANKIGAVGTPILLSSNATTQAKSLLISGNSFRRYSGHGISLEYTSVRYGKVNILGNTFDGDPYFESANRTAGPDGTWSTGAQAPTSVDAVKFKGVRLANNVFRNLNQVIHSDSNTLIEYQGNCYIYQPNSADALSSSSASNKGIRSHAGIGDISARIVWEDSDPTSSTYGQELDRNGALAASAMPSTGYYVTGQFVSNTAITESGSATSKYTVLGWKRLTTGNSHTLNTDWRELRGLTGN